MGLEIERKYLIKNIPENLSDYPHLNLTQAYLNTSPVVRVRKEDDNYYLTYKGSGLLSREEYNLPLNEESFYHLLEKADGNVIAKCRYQIPYFCNGKEYIIELDIFDKPFAPLVLAEVEFADEKDASGFTAPFWFGDEVTYDTKYHNSNMSRINIENTNF